MLITYFCQLLRGLSEDGSVLYFSPRTLFSILMKSLAKFVLGRLSQIFVAVSSNCHKILIAPVLLLTLTAHPLPVTPV